MLEISAADFDTSVERLRDSTTSACDHTARSCQTSSASALASSGLLEASRDLHSRSGSISRTQNLILPSKMVASHSRGRIATRSIRDQLSSLSLQWKDRKVGEIAWKLKTYGCSKDASTGHLSARSFISPTVPQTLQSSQSNQSDNIQTSVFSSVITYYYILQKNYYSDIFIYQLLQAY